MLELLLYQLFVSEASEVEPTGRATRLTDTIDGPNRDWSRSHRHSVQYRIEGSVRMIHASCSISRSTYSVVTRINIVPNR